MYRTPLKRNEHFQMINKLCGLYGKPLIITEFSVRDRSVRSNYRGAGIPTVSDSEARGVFYKNYLNHIVKNPFVIGAHYFRWVDRGPADFVKGKYGNFEGPIGLVNTDDEPWIEFIKHV